MPSLAENILYASDDLHAQIAANPDAPARSLNLATLEALAAQARENEPEPVEP